MRSKRRVITIPHNFALLFAAENNMQKREEEQDEHEDLEKRRGRMDKRERERGRGREKRGGVCPGLPSPSGVHLVTHPLHRAQYV